MAIVALKGMKFYAYHGVYEAERKIGGEYVVDVEVRVAIDKAAATDQLEYALNYETVYQICRLEMDQPRNLIEAVLGGIVGRMKHHFKNMEALTVRVYKMQPPLGGRVGASMVESSQEYLADCPRCKSKFVRYNNDDCFERFPNLHPATRQTLARQFGPACLCDNCLAFYAG
jgi:7,8-dihydroneopterin aldolase/epimerase/oxygenase